MTNNRAGSGLEYLRDENSTSMEEVEYSLRRAAEKVSEQVREDYNDFLYRKFGVLEGQEGLGPNPERANPETEFETSDEFGHRIEYHKRMYEIAEERGVDLPESPIEFQPDEDKYDDYTPENPLVSKDRAVDEFIHKMPTGFSLAMDMSQFESEN